MSATIVGPLLKLLINVLKLCKLEDAKMSVPSGTAVRYKKRYARVCVLDILILQLEK